MFLWDLKLHRRKLLVKRPSRFLRKITFCEERVHATKAEAKRMRTKAETNRIIPCRSGKSRKQKTRKPKKIRKKKHSKRETRKEKKINIEEGTAGKPNELRA